MNMTQKLSALAMVEKEIETLIIQQVPETEDVKIIKDGIVDKEKFLTASYKVLWILKEAYCEGDGTGGGWDMRLMLREKANISGGGRNFFNRITLVTWSILNGFPSWNDMEDVDEKPEMLNALKSIAYVNIRKLPGRTTSDYSEIDKAYQENKQLLHKQIEAYNPDIVIFGGTFGHFKSDLGVADDEIMTTANSYGYFFKNNRIYIRANHPAVRTLNHEEYCDMVIDAAKQINLRQGL